MPRMIAALLGPLLKYASSLRFPWLFGLVGLVFLADVLVPDLIPFVDEVMLGLVTALLGSVRKERGERDRPAPEDRSASRRTIDVEPESPER